MKGSALHAEIMNLQTKNDSEILAIVETTTRELGLGMSMPTYLRLEFERILVLAYKIGNRDARHAAAELALKP